MEVTKLDYMNLLTNNFTSLYDIAGQLAECTRGIHRDVHYVDNQGIWPCQIYGINMSEDSIDQRLDWIVASIKRGILPNKIGTSQYTKPENYAEYFEKHQIDHSHNATAMALNTENFSPITNETTTIKVVETDEELTAFCEIVIKELFHSSLDKLDPYFKCMKALKEAGKIDMYIALLDDQVVATSMVYYDGSSAGLYHIATDSNHRGKGIGKQITSAPIEAAISKGYETIVLFASDLGLPVYKKLGFETYGLLGRYKVNH